MLLQFKILLHALKRNGLLQLFFYLSNLDAVRFIEYSKTVEYLDKEDAQIILDLGTGYSVLPSFLKENLKSTYVTLDLSLNACKYQADCNIADMHQILSDMRHLQIKSLSISVVIAISSIEHVGKMEHVDDALIFKEIYRVLKQGGVAIVSLPYSYKCPKIVRMAHSYVLLSLLHKLRVLWLMFLGKHFYYFIEQTTTDSIMKYYDDNEITDILSNGLSLERRYYYGKKILSRFFRCIPLGWFVLKDLLFGLTLSKIDDALGNTKDASGVVLKIRKLR
jgi:ubiquinone/menaquinone biosynthesis C-methylase UbiE